MDCENCFFYKRDGQCPSLPSEPICDLIEKVEEYRALKKTGKYNEVHKFLCTIEKSGVGREFNILLKAFYPLI